jgi:hypothetical protein
MDIKIVLIHAANENAEAACNEIQGQVFANKKELKEKLIERLGKLFNVGVYSLSKYVDMRNGEEIHPEEYFVSYVRMKKNPQTP